MKLARPPEEITIYEIVEAIDGAPIMNVCVDREDACPYTDFCKMHELWKELQDYIVQRLKNTKVSDVVVDYGKES